ncbi:hypothetical protein Nocox_26405 [Nonomuraea coxensis DSM 45129]|uniref:Lipoprotein n=1 Tax=Nonomuraea coxensis DSM 45129 TaxID=1122611 RepID=A0ABX8U892_9ACTN|nr:hypothetical protein [Nonomuraea coxensis]QYC42882.1 hypothetical protein Nocox_26405 [Nonomuraea coxensis DSM 45129]
MKDQRPPTTPGTPLPPQAGPPWGRLTRGTGAARARRPVSLALVAATAAVSALTGCGAASPAAHPAGATSATRTGEPSGEGSDGRSGGPDEAGPARPTAEAGAGRALPAPGEPLPATPARLATALRETTAALDEAIDRWKPAKGGPPRDVELLALYQQRLYRHAARHRTLADRAFARLPAALAGQARDNVAAIRELLALARPIKPSRSSRPARPPSCSGTSSAASAASGWSGRCWPP